MNKRVRALIVAISVLAVLGIMFYGVYTYGQYRCKPCVVKQVVAKSKPIPIKKPQQKIAKRQVVESLTLTPALALIPALVSAPQKITLRLNVVEWSQIFEGRSLMSRDIGFLIRKGLSDGTVVRAMVPLTFDVNGVKFTVQGGQIVLNLGQIGPETSVVVQPLGNVQFASPPDGLPLVAGPGELDFLVKKWARELWLNFILAPRQSLREAPKGASRLYFCFY